LAHSTISHNSIEETNYRREFGGAETGAIKLHRTHNTTIENNLIRQVRTIDSKSSNGDGIWLDVENYENSIRNNVIVEVEGNSILMEANWVGTNDIENNIVVGGRLATFSARDTVWRYNLLVDALGYWVNQVDLDRPAIEGAIWSNNVFIRRGVADGPDATRDNLYLGGAKRREGEQGAVVTSAEPHFAIDMDGAEVTVSFAIDPAVYRRLHDRIGDGVDFYGHERGKGDFAFGPFSNVVAGKNCMSVFRCSPRRARALEILRSGIR